MHHHETNYCPWMYTLLLRNKTDMTKVYKLLKQPLYTGTEQKTTNETEMKSIVKASGDVAYNKQFLGWFL